MADEANSNADDDDTRPERNGVGQMTDYGKACREAVVKRRGKGLLDLPLELMCNVMEHVDCLDDLRSLSLTNRLMAGYVGSIEAKTLWGITVRSFQFDCGLHVDGRCLCWCWRGLVGPSLERAGSRPWKVRAWLYRRASIRSFGHSEECLAGCQVPIVCLRPNARSVEELEWNREWNAVWTTFGRYLTRQRVERVNMRDGRVRPEWRRDYWEDWNDMTDRMRAEDKALAVKGMMRWIWRMQCYGRIVSG